MPWLTEPDDDEEDTIDGDGDSLGEDLPIKPSLFNWCAVTPSSAPSSLPQRILTIQFSISNMHEHDFRRSDGIYLDSMKQAFSVVLNTHFHRLTHLRAAKGLKAKQSNKVGGIKASDMGVHENAAWNVVDLIITGECDAWLN